jgi:hypothetical protein
MTRRKKTDGERIAFEVFSGRYQGMAIPSELATDIDRLIRRRMAEAYEIGWFHGTHEDRPHKNPYRGRKKKQWNREPQNGLRRARERSQLPELPT